MKELVYKSKAKLPLSSSDITNLLEKSRTFNDSKNITGILLFDNSKNFIQLLEGKDEDIDALFSKIKLDPRHRDIIVIHEDTCVQRTFKNWSMEYLYLDSVFNGLVPDDGQIDTKQKELIMENFVSIITQHFDDILEKG